MKTLILALVALQTAGAPTAAQFNRALADACPTPRSETRNISCARAEEGSIQFSCAYEMRGANGAWAHHTAILQQAEGQWVWIDGPTRCDSEQPELN
ncbi:MAG: hypothetical protein ACT4N8_09120 [Sphingosinicella sp.]|uniref:hypothetical protein n=1 Tax=Sphingosinicella sp. TaxID=1917971 RepID=UPI0040380456